MFIIKLSHTDTYMQSIKMHLILFPIIFYMDLFDYLTFFFIQNVMKFNDLTVERKENLLFTYETLKTRSVKKFVQGHVTSKRQGQDM